MVLSKMNDSHLIGAVNVIADAGSDIWNLDGTLKKDWRVSYAYHIENNKKLLDALELKKKYDKIMDAIRDTKKMNNGLLYKFGEKTKTDMIHLLNEIKILGRKCNMQDRNKKWDQELKDHDISDIKDEIKVTFVERFINNMTHGLYQNILQGLSSKEKGIREIIAQNMNPFGYSIRDKLESLMKFDYRYTKENYPSLDENTKIRIDMFRQYLGLDPFGHSLDYSQHIPTKCKNGEEKKYYDFSPEIKTNALKEIKKYMQSHNLGSSFSDLVGYIEKYQGLPGSSFVRDGSIDIGYINDVFSQLGNYHVDIKSYKEGEVDYISYYDIWDLDPLSEQKAPQGLLGKVKNKSVQLMKGFVPHANFNHHGIYNSFEVYGRIYEDEYNAM